MIAYDYNSDTTTDTTAFDIFRYDGTASTAGTAITSRINTKYVNYYCEPPYDDFGILKQYPDHDIRSFSFIKKQTMKYYRKAVFNYVSINISLNNYFSNYKKLDSRSGYKGLKRLKRERG